MTTVKSSPCIFPLSVLYTRYPSSSPPRQISTSVFATAFSSRSRFQTPPCPIHDDTLSLEVKTPLSKEPTLIRGWRSRPCRLSQNVTTRYFSEKLITPGHAREDARIIEGKRNIRESNFSSKNVQLQIVFQRISVKYVIIN